MLTEDLVDPSIYHSCSLYADKARKFAAEYFDVQGPTPFELAAVVERRFDSKVQRLVLGVVVLTLQYHRTFD